MHWWWVTKSSSYLVISSSPKSRFGCMSEKDAGVRALVRWLWHALVVLFYLFSWGWQIWRHWVTSSWTWYNIFRGIESILSCVKVQSFRSSKVRTKMSSKTWVMCILTIRTVLHIVYKKNSHYYWMK